MNKHLLQAVTLFFFLFTGFYKAEARVWRVNNTAGVTADYTELSQALASGNVLAGDTIYVEGSDKQHATAYLKKKLVIIGTGYFLDKDGNPGLQYSVNPSEIQIVMDDSLASGSTLLGLTGRIQIHPSIDDLTISRCNVDLGDANSRTGAVMKNISITKSYVSLYFQGSFEHLYLANNIIHKYAYLPNAINSIIRNNILPVQLVVQASSITNNIFVNSSLKATNCLVKYNIATNNILPAGDNNKNNLLATELFVESNCPDAKYQLKAGSPARAAGEPINGITPDAGPFGTADPYRLSGIPPIPTIYQLTAPETVPISASKMTVTFSTRSNN